MEKGWKQVFLTAFYYPVEMAEYFRGEKGWK